MSRIRRSAGVALTAVLGFAVGVAPAGMASASGPGVHVDGVSAPGLLTGGSAATVDVVIGNDAMSSVDVVATVGVPAGWEAARVSIEVASGASVTVGVPVRPPLAPALATLTAEVSVDQQVPVSGAPSTQVVTTPPGGSVPLALDAGGASSPVLDGYQRLAPEDSWDPVKGYGWVGDPPAYRDRGTPDALRRDFALSTSPSTLRLAVPPGQHDVYLLRGDATFSSGDTVVSAEGVVLADPGDVLPTGAFQWERFWLDGGPDGRTADLSIAGAVGDNWRLAALVMMPGAAAPVAVAPAGPPGRPVADSLFGMDVNLHGSITETTPTVRTSWYRLWDSRVNWQNVEPARGQWNWADLDTWVDTAQAHHANVLYTLGLTPKWAVPPDAPWVSFAGSSVPPTDMSDWDEFIAAIATRYRGRIGAYELWNEPNISTFYTGSPAALVEMARRAYTAIKTIDPEATVVCPSVTSVTGPTSSGVRTLDQYLDLGLAQYCDAIGVHLYTHVSSGHLTAAPETWINAVGALRAMLAAHHVNKPIWNTETGWGRAGTPPVIPVYTGALANGLVARSYILAANLGLSQYTWYAWTNRWAGLYLDTDWPDATGTRPPTDAGRTYETVQDWLVGGQLTGCTDTGIPGVDGGWACGIHYPQMSLPGILQPGEARAIVLWCTTGTTRVTLPAGTIALRSLPTGDRAAQPGETVSVGTAPILVVTR